eukprot:TRINITY_DN45391_c0_g1_i1.p1 TRINITY_DN45391_c0_g1~~TRINITY_DN45391_c0_g1_i1.p1  ORF type:complete len:641 (-),score=132.88 TRINITY_DN45391_c0_g1_i1:101-2023(-)
MARNIILRVAIVGIIMIMPLTVLFRSGSSGEQFAVSLSELNVSQGSQRQNQDVADPHRNVQSSPVQLTTTEYTSQSSFLATTPPPHDSQLGASTHGAIHDAQLDHNGAAQASQKPDAASPETGASDHDEGVRTAPVAAPQQESNTVHSDEAAHADPAGDLAGSQITGAPPVADGEAAAAASGSSAAGAFCNVSQASASKEEAEASSRHLPPAVFVPPPSSVEAACLPRFAAVAAAANLTPVAVFAPVGPNVVTLRSVSAAETFAALLLPYVVHPPQRPLTVHARPFALPRPEEVDCGDSMFHGRRATPAKVVDLTYIGYEVDVLEMRLYELMDVVDEHFIFEGVWSARNHLKPLFMAASAARIARFLPRVTHVVQDMVAEAEIGPRARDSDHHAAAWKNEGNMRKWVRDAYLKLRVQQGNHASMQQFHNTVFIASDLDEVPSARYVQRLKYCQLAGPRFHIPMTNLHGTADWAAGNWDVPVVLTAEELLKGGHVIMRSGVRARVGTHGGSHVSRVLPGAAQLLKMMYQPDGPVRIPLPDGHGVEVLFEPSRWWRLIAEQLGYDKLKNPPPFGVRRQPAQLGLMQPSHATRYSDHPEPKYRPWLLEHNRERFPYAWVDLWPQAAEWPECPLVPEGPPAAQG